MKFKTISILCLLLAGILNTQAQKFEGIAETPPMGWNSWNHFACDVNEDLIRGIADMMAANGMKEAGYEYVNIDDCWHGERDADGFIQADPERFPSGIKALADYIHSKGLKIGIYSDAGWKTCGGKEGSRGYEYQDAMQYARWGIDYLKYDWCNTEELNAKGAYLTMRDALYKAGRPIVLSICEWGDNDPATWAGEIGHLWRTTGDIINCWDCEKGYSSWSSWGIMRILDMQKGLRKYAGPGHWNDPDMMEVGNMPTVNEDRAHFSMWCMLAAPLIAGNDIRGMTDATLEILTNEGAIAINQDKLGVQGWKFHDEGAIEIWFKPLDGGDFGMCILNRGDIDQTVEFDWADEYVKDDLLGYSAEFQKINYDVYNVWAKAAAGTTKTKLVVEVPSRDVAMYRLTKNP